MFLFFKFELFLTSITCNTSETLLCSFAELSINQVNVEEEGITFPTKNDNSNITENPATFLELPKQTSKTNTGRTVMLSVGI